MDDDMFRVGALQQHITPARVAIGMAAWSNGAG